MSKESSYITQIPEFPLSKLLFADMRFSYIWLIIRVYVGWEWLVAGWKKLQNPIWIGAKAGIALRSYVSFAVTKVSGQHPDVQNWYAWFLHGVILPHAQAFSYVVTFGEIAVGFGLILGTFTDIAAFFEVL